VLKIQLQEQSYLNSF